LAHPVDAGSDIFALGAVLYEMLTGQAAFAGESVTAILLNVVSREPVTPTLVDPGLPSALDYVLARCLAKDRQARYPDARSLALDLENVLAGRAARGQSDWKPASASGTLIGSPASSGGGTGRAAQARAVAPAPPTVVSAKPRAVVPHARRAPPRRGWRAYAVAAAGSLGLLAAVFLVLRPEPVARRVTAEPAAVAPLPTPSVRDAAGTPEPTPAPEVTPPLRPREVRPPEPARDSGPALLSLELEHSLRAGTLRVWIDDDQVVERELDGRVAKEIVGIKLHKGRLSEELEVTPGRRELRVRIDWDDKSQSDSMRINFEAGETYRVRAKLGSLGGIRKNLSLGWY